LIWPFVKLVIRCLTSLILQWVPVINMSLHSETRLHFLALLSKVAKKRRPSKPQAKKLVKKLRIVLSQFLRAFGCIAD
jgi:hypothetical protein